MLEIAEINAYEVYDSRGELTLEVEVGLSSGACGRAIIPSGVSMGNYEAIELRDNDIRYNGKGLLRAIDSVQSSIAPVLRGKNPYNQAEIDKVLIDLDGTDNKGNLGANAILGVSLAVAKSSAAQLGLPLYQYIGGKIGRELPLPILTMISGGRHGGDNIDFQDFQIIPIKARDFRDAMHMGKIIYDSLKCILIEKKIPVGVSGTGGFMPRLQSNEHALHLLLESVERAGYVPGEDICFSIDVAAEMFYRSGKYQMTSEGCNLSSIEMVDMYETWIRKYPIVLIEDPLGEDDYVGWREITRRIGNSVELVGDDLFATNMNRFKTGINNGMANAILVKPNQIGTLSETLDIIEEAKVSGYGVIISRRSGETEDTFIADLSVATNCGKVKFGSFARTEGLAKYNRLLRIESELGAATMYRGKKALKHDASQVSGNYKIIQRRGESCFSIGPSIESVG